MNVHVCVARPVMVSYTHIAPKRCVVCF